MKTKILAISLFFNATTAIARFVTPGDGYTPMVNVEKDRFVGIDDAEVITKIILIHRNNVVAIGTIVDMLERIGLGTGNNMGSFVFRVEHVELSPYMYVPTGILTSQERVNHFETEQERVNYFETEEVTTPPGILE